MVVYVRVDDFLFACVCLVVVRCVGVVLVCVLWLHFSCVLISCVAFA